MLERFLETTAPLLPITFIEENYFMDIRGTIYTHGSTGYNPLNRTTVLPVTINGTVYNVQLANLVQLVWKPVFEPDILYYLLEADVLFSDLNERNYHPINLIWKLSDNRLGKMYRIPGFSRYLFTEDFRLYDRIRDDFIKITYEKNRYVSCNIYPDYTNKTRWYVLHRMIAYCFLDYTECVERLDVNHIDGNKWNYLKDNLEWVSRSGNNLHAIISGLKNDANSVRVYNTETGEISEYISQSLCAKALNIDKKLLSWRLIHGGDKVWDGKYKFEIIGHGIKRKKYATEPKITILRNRVTGEFKEFTSLSKASVFLNIGYAALKNRVRRNSNLFGDWELKSYNPKLGEIKPTF